MVENLELLSSVDYCLRYRGRITMPDSMPQLEKDPQSLSQQCALVLSQSSQLSLTPERNLS